MRCGNLWAITASVVGSRNRTVGLNRVIEYQIGNFGLATGPERSGSIADGLARRPRSGLRAAIG